MSKNLYVNPNGYTVYFFSEKYGPFLFNEVRYTANIYDINDFATSLQNKSCNPAIIKVLKKYSIPLDTRPRVKVKLTVEAVRELLLSMCVAELMTKGGI